jgi:outer membrane immunogenic protein
MTRPTTGFAAPRRRCVLRPTKRVLCIMKTLLSGAAVALLLVTSNAVADGMPRRATMVAPIPAPTPIWTGFYIGVGVGGAFATHDHSGDLDGLRLFHDDRGDARFFGTVTVGYDAQFSSRWVAGVFVDYDFGNRGSDSSFANLGPLNNVHLSSEHGNAWSLGGRLGFLSSPTTLLYASAGWTQVSFDGDVSFSFGGTQHSRSFDIERDGWFLGAGIETQLGWLSSNWSLRAEYRFTQLDDDHRRFNFAQGSRLEFDHDIDIHSVRAVLSYKFGRQVGAPW